MQEKISTFKDGFNGIIDLCNEMDSVTLLHSVSAIADEVDELNSDDDMEEGLSLLAELLMHVNDLDEEYAEQYEEVIKDINDIAEDLRDL